MPEASNFQSVKVSEDHYGHKAVLSFEVRWNPNDKEDQKAVKECVKTFLNYHLMSSSQPGGNMAHYTQASNLKRENFGKEPKCRYSVEIYWNNADLEELAMAMYYVWEPNTRPWSEYVEKVGKGAEEFRELARKQYELVHHFPRDWTPAHVEMVAALLYENWCRFPSPDRNWKKYLETPNAYPELFRKMAVELKGVVATY